MTGQVLGHQSPDEPGGAEDHHIQLTLPAHPSIVSKPAPDGRRLPRAWPDGTPVRPGSASLLIEASRRVEGINVCTLEPLTEPAQGSG